MKFGNYNINQSPKEKSRRFDVFRFSKIKSTTNSFVGRFHSKIETFRRLKSRSESPLSYRASLFERDGMFSRTVCEKFSPKYFPKNHHNSRDNFYVFGNTIRKWSDNQRTISGKNNYLSEHYYCTLRSDGTSGGSRVMPLSSDVSLQRSVGEDVSVAVPRSRPNVMSMGGARTWDRMSRVEVTVPPTPVMPATGAGTKSCATLTRKKAAADGCATKKPLAVDARGLISITSQLVNANKGRPWWAMGDGSGGGGGVGHMGMSNGDSFTMLTAPSTIDRRVHPGAGTFKEILDSMSHLDEDAEFKVLKDYFETTSYSDIVRDSHFKDYLNRKNYRDILDYINEGSVVTDTSTMRTRSRPYEDLASYDANATDASKMCKSKSMGDLYESLTTYNNRPAVVTAMIPPPETQASTLKRQREPPKFISTPSLGQYTLQSDAKHYDVRYHEKDGVYRANSTSTLPNPKRATRCAGANHQQHVRNHDEIKRICESFLNENLMFNKKKSGGGGYDTTTLAKQYTERQYKKLISKFVKTKGYNTTEEYVQTKFGSVLDRSIPNYAQNAQKLDLPKTYLDNVQRRYQVTKQHFMAAEQMRSAQAHAMARHTQMQRPIQSTNDLYRTMRTDPFNPLDEYERTRHRYYRTLGGCTGCAGVCGSRMRDSFSLPSTLNGPYDDLPYYFGRKPFGTIDTRYSYKDAASASQNVDSEAANDDILCDCCMDDYMRQPVPYRRAYYNVCNDLYTCDTIQRKQNSVPSATQTPNTSTLQSQQSRQRQQQPTQSVRHSKAAAAPSTPTASNTNTASCANYVK